MTEEQEQTTTKAQIRTSLSKQGYSILKSSSSDEHIDKIKKQVMVLYNILLKFRKIGHSLMNSAIKKYILDFKKYFTTDGNIETFNIDIDITGDVFEFINRLRTLIMSMKESRDIYYLIEIKEMMKKIDSAQFFFITSDEITNYRCILEKISTINIYNKVPRYIVNIKNKKIAIKLFNIFHNLVSLSALSEPTQRNIQKTREYNNGLIMTQSKSLIIKNYKGGVIKNELKIINPTINITQLKMDSKIQERLSFINKKDYKQIENFVIKSRHTFWDLTSFFSDEYTTIEEITKQNPIYLTKIKQIKELFYDLIYLYDNISRQELINNLEYLPFVRNINNIFEGYSSKEGDNTCISPL